MGTVILKLVVAAYYFSTCTCYRYYVLYIILRGHWCDIIVLNVHTPTEGKIYDVKDSFYEELGHWCDIILNVHAPTENKIYDVKDSFYEELENVFNKFHKYKYHTKILLGDFNAKVGREDIFKPTIGNDSLHRISNDNGVRVVNFVTSKNLIVKSTMFPHRNIHKFTCTSPDGKTHNRIDHILIDRRRHSSILDVLSFGAADCDTGHYLVVAKVRRDWE
jgi:hypothetical protein